MAKFAKTPETLPWIPPGQPKAFIVIAYFIAKSDIKCSVKAYVKFNVTLKVIV